MQYYDKIETLFYESFSLHHESTKGTSKDQTSPIDATKIEILRQKLFAVLEYENDLKQK